ncbi:MAG: metallophosphoesterase [Deltaproteobacteria bacterium]|nr:metallophosphoesterase [Deltaproteobacteria bacterium]
MNNRRIAGLVTATLCLAAPSAALAGGPETAHHGRGTAGIFWFMHLSDSHIGASLFEGPDAAAHLEFAFDQGVQVIEPSFVVATGDLCDGSINDIPATGQDQGEWDTYSGLTTQFGMTADFYFDLPGNHDGYGDIGLNYYLANSVQGQAGGALYTDWVVQSPVGKEFYFFGLNSAGNGSGPFLEDPAFTGDEIAALEAGLQAHANAELTFVFAHHQLGYPDNSGQVVDAILTGGGAYYLHGHRHSYNEYLAGNATIVVNEIDSVGKHNTHNIGVGVIDHNAFVYRSTDVTGAWPLLIISAPVSNTLRGDSTPHPYAYDVCKDRTDNPVRAEVFSVAETSEVTVEVGGLPPVAMATAPDSTKIWEAEVDTTSLTAGDHAVVVTATVAGDVVQESITATFVEGPCEDLPIEAVPAAGGAGGAGGFGGQAVGGYGGFGGAGGGLAPVPPVDEEGGCGCRQAGASQPAPRAAGLALGWLGLALLGYRRGRRRPSRR